METPSLKELLETFYELSGMDLAVFNTDLRCVMNVTYDAPYCSAIHRSGACLEQCRASDREAFERVAESHRPYLYTCPFGLEEAIFPILDGEKCMGYLFMGPSLGEGAEEEEILHWLHRTDEHLDRELIRQRLASFPRTSKKKMESCVRLATVMAEYIVRHRLVLPRAGGIGRQVKEYVRTNLGEKITLSMLSKALHCSTVTLTESFRRENGITVMEYVARERLRLAKELLREDEYSIREIAEQCGFPDPEYFSRFFKERVGESPSGWRTRQQGSTEGPAPIE